MAVHYISGIIIAILLFAILLQQINWQYEYSGWTQTVNITGSIIKFTRSDTLILTAHGKISKIDVFKSLGWMHAHDRYVQMCLYRLAAKGLLTAHLPFSKSSLKSDVKAKQMNIAELSKQSLPHIPQEYKSILQHYTDGINTYFKTNPRPVEFIILNYQPEPFEIEDYFSILNYVAYAGLNDISLTVEKLIIELASETNFDLDILKSTFSPHLKNLDDDLIEVYKSLKDVRPLADHDTSDIPKLVNSNNWVVSGALTESGMPLLASDPHMDVSKYPNIFYESHYIGEDGFSIFGISGPGFSSYLFGRTNHIGACLTFGMLDMSDYFIEDIRDMHYKRDGTYHSLKERTYEINGKLWYFYDTKDGHTLERSMEALNKPITNGKYLATKFSISTETDIVNSKVLTLFFAKDVYEAKECVSENSLGSNYLFADKDGNIAYQQGGMVPNRTTSNGLVPIPAWDSSNLWKNYLTGDDYLSIVNPPEGYLATANNHIQAEDKPIVATFSALPNRVNRVYQLLQSKKKYSVDDFKQYQSDTHSLMAEKIVPMIKTLLGKTGIERELAEWDYKYTLDSKPAAFYKMFHQQLQRNVLLQLLHKDRVTKYLQYAAYPMSTIIDSIIGSGFVRDVPISDIMRSALEQTLQNYKGEVYADLEHFFMKNLMFGGNLPAWLGLDVPLRSTNHCDECVKVGVTRKNQEGALIYISQAWRMVTDMGTDEIHSVLPGGPSGNILSNLYQREVDMFLDDQYKITQLNPTDHGN